MQLFLKSLNGMANSVDPGQTAPVYAILRATLVYEILRHLPYHLFSNLQSTVWVVNSVDPDQITNT